jgi:hypothetical protein
MLIAAKRFDTPLLWQLHFAQECLVAWVALETLEQRIMAQEDW